jgi:hypothetical protein
MKVVMSAVLSGWSVLLLSSGQALAGPGIIQIPEPSSLALIAAGAGVVAWIKFRHRP